MTVAATSLAPGAVSAPGAGVYAALIRRVARGDYDRWINGLGPAAGCLHPIKLRGQRTEVEAPTGRILHDLDTAELPDGVLYVPCGNRRTAVCPSCAETYRADTYQLVSAGLIGGKGVPTSVSKHPCVFFTPTAPGFGLVHTHRLDADGNPGVCHARRDAEVCPHGVLMDCRRRHDADDRLRGAPLCLDCYDAAGQAVWNGWSGELWRRTRNRANQLLKNLERRYGCMLKLSYTKVAEFQHRGVVHFHALVRIDGRDPLDPEAVLEPDLRIRTHHLEQILLEAARHVSVTTPPHPRRPAGWTVRWGEQLDTRPVTLTVRDVDAEGEISYGAVAGYLAKYATKSTETTGHVSARINESTIDLHANPDTLAGRMIGACWDLGYRPDEAHPDEWAKSYGRLRRWAHMLGFGGHLSTKSRRYSTTLGALRRARRDWHRAQVAGPEDLDLVDDDTTLVVGTLTFAGIGWHTSADALLANSAAARAREYRRTAREELSTQS